MSKSVLTAIAAVAAIALLLAPARSAEAQSLGVSVRGGASAPIGSYAATEGANAAHAGTGFGIGLDLEWRLVPEFAVLASVGTSFHNPQQSLLDGRDDVAFDEGVFYIHFPIMAGARVRVPMGGVALAGLVQAGVLIVDGPAEHGLGDESQVPLVYVGYDLTPNFALGIGLEIETGARWRPGIRFLAAPDARFVANASRFGAWPPTNEEFTLGVSYMEIYLGYLMNSMSR